jgi:hypothetical protein
MSTAMEPDALVPVWFDSGARTRCPPSVEACGRIVLTTGSSRVYSVGLNGHCVPTITNNKMMDMFLLALRALLLLTLTGHAAVRDGIV